MISLDFVHPHWMDWMQPTFIGEPMRKTLEQVDQGSIQPHRPDIFNAFREDPFKIKVVILGQDPYPKPGDATGYAFMVRRKEHLPVSLKNIYEEIRKDYPQSEPDMSAWPSQGVFLLNTALTVPTGNAGGHIKLWEGFTRAVIRELSSRQGNIWILMGRYAAGYQRFIRNPIDATAYMRGHMEDLPLGHERSNYLLITKHPAAEAYRGGNAGFFGSHCFKACNELLIRLKMKPIIW